MPAYKKNGIVYIPVSGKVSPNDVQRSAQPKDWWQVETESVLELPTIVTGIHPALNSRIAKGTQIDIAARKRVGFTLDHSAPCESERKRWVQHLTAGRKKLWTIDSLDERAQTVTIEDDETRADRLTSGEQSDEEILAEMAEQLKAARERKRELAAREADLEEMTD